MEQRISSCYGCLLGLAVGDAMGSIIDKKSWTVLSRNYSLCSLWNYNVRNDTAIVLFLLCRTVLFVIAGSH